MTNPLESLGTILLFLLPGLGLAWFFPGLRALPLTRRLGYAYPLGVLAVAGSLYALSHLAGLPIRRPAIFAAAALPALAGLAARFLRPRVRPLPSRRPALPVLAAAAVVAGVFAGIFADGVSEPLRDWDGRMHWASQGRYIRDAGSVHPAAMAKGQWFVNHPRYPVLLPVAQAASLEVFGADEDEMPFRALYAAFFPALALVIFDGAARWAGRTPAALTAITLAALPFFTFGSDGSAMSAYSDLPLGCFYGAALVLLLRSRPRVSDGVAAGLMLAAAALTKNEGTLLAGFALVAASVPLALSWWRKTRAAEPRPERRRRLLLRGARLCSAAALLLVAVALFLSWRSEIPNRQDEMYDEFVEPEHFWPNAITRIPEVLPVILDRMLLFWRHWSGFWWVAPFVLLAGWRGFRGRRAALFWPLLIAAAGPLAVAWGAYSVHWDPDELAKVTWERFLVQGSAPFLLLFSLALRDLLRRTPLRLAHK